MDIPKELKYTLNHEWVRVDGDFAYIGITDFAQGELGDIVYFESDRLNDTIPQGDVFGTVEAVKTVSDIYMPISGEIIELNEQLDSDPELINSSPYKDGWLIKIKPSDLSEFSELLTADKYKEEINA